MRFDKFFPNSTYFKGWNVAADVRWGFDACVGMREEKDSRARKRIKEGGKKGGDEDEGDEVFTPPRLPNLLNLDGRKFVITEMLKPFTDNPTDHSDASKEVNALLSSFSFSTTSEEDGFKDDLERYMISASLISHVCLSYMSPDYPTPPPSSKTSQPPPSLMMRCFSLPSTLALLAFDGVSILERRGHHDVAVNVLANLTVNYGYGVKRRTMGKIVERLTVDVKHVEGRNKKFKKGKGGEGGMKEMDKLTTTTTTPTTTTTTTTKTSYDMAKVRDIVSRLVAHTQPTSGKPIIPYSTVLSLLSRLKLPLSTTSSNTERSKLGMTEGYNVKVDVGVANAMRWEGEDGGEERRKGKAEFVSGREDEDEDRRGWGGRVSVERLALDCHRLGTVGELGSGWSGWHDEGGMIKKVFKVWVERCIWMEGGGMTVGNPWSFNTLELTEDYGGERKFDKYIDEIRSLPPASLIPYIDTLIRNHGDFQSYTSIRTLSMLCAGIGQKGIAAIFNALVYDPRHYGAGMPDLTLIRASYDDKEGETVDLGKWIGEGFSKSEVERLREIKGKKMLRDRDEDLLIEDDIGRGGRGGRRRDLRFRKRQGGEKKGAGDGGDATTTKGKGGEDEGANLPVSSVKQSTPPSTPPRKPEAAEFSPAKPRQSFLGFLPSGMGGGATKKNKKGRITNGTISCSLPDGGWRTGEGKEDRVLILRHKWEELKGVEGRVRVIGLDFDDTLVVSNRGGVNWKLRFPHVIDALRRIFSMNKEGGNFEHNKEDDAPGIPTALVIVTNESLGKYKKEPALRKALHTKAAKVGSFCKALGLPILVVMPTAKDKYRKGLGTGSWELMKRIFKEEKGVEVDDGLSCFVGDAGGGGVVGDYDKEFAKVCGVKYFREREFFGWKGEGKEGGGKMSKGYGGEEGWGENKEGEEEEEEKEPELLKLEFEGRKVKVEVLFSEVKSANDTLDKRQETWLNILESAGVRARVCKFKESGGSGKFGGSKKRASPDGEMKKKMKKKNKKTEESTGKRWEGVEEGKFGVRRVTKVAVVQLDVGDIVDTTQENKVVVKVYDDGEEASKAFQLEVKSAIRARGKKKEQNGVILELWSGNECVLREDVGRGK